MDKYGVINEDMLILRSPRGIDGDEHDSLRGAFNEALRMITDGEAETLSIVRCFYSERHQAWVEEVGGG